MKLDRPIVLVTVPLDGLPLVVLDDGRREKAWDEHDSWQIVQAGWGKPMIALLNLWEANEGNGVNAGRRGELALHGCHLPPVFAQAEVPEAVVGFEAYVKSVAQARGVDPETMDFEQAWDLTIDASGKALARLVEKAKEAVKTGLGVLGVLGLAVTVIGLTVKVAELTQRTRRRRRLA